MSRLEQLSIEIQKDHLETKSWRKTADKFGVNSAAARLIAKGYEPGNRMRKQLGLPLLGKVEVCETCGKPHRGDDCQTETVSAKRNQRKRPRPSYKKLWQQSLLMMAWILKEDNDGQRHTNDV